MKRWLPRILLLPAAMLLALPGAMAQQRWQDDDGGQMRSIVIGDDLYTSGGDVTISQAPAGDVVAAGGRVVLAARARATLIMAGGQVSVRDSVAGDALLAGGNVEVQAPVGDDLRMAGGNLSVDATVARDAVMAGGTVTLGPNGHIGGEASVAGGEIAILGEVQGALSLIGERVEVNGTLRGPVTVRAFERLRIGPNARISGPLTYHSPGQAEIDPAAVVSGEVRHIPMERHYREAAPWVAASIGSAILGWIALGVLAAVMLGLFPLLVGESLGGLRTRPWLSLLLGLALFFTTPAVAVVLLITVIGLPLGLVLLFLIYPLALLGGWLTAALYLGDWGLGLVNRKAGRGLRILFAFLGVAVLGLMAAIPFLGGLICLIATSVGLGTLAHTMWRRYHGAGSRHRHPVTRHG